uniref:Succinate dehydrogenase complex assembly factor 4 n=1 Tax=Felis catus TaxID=9685 RepID=A0ABI7XV91_FELCA
MTVTRLARLLGYIPATAWRAARSPLVCCSVRKMSSQGEKSKPIKQSHKKPKLPEGRFDAPEDPNLEKEPLTILEAGKSKIKVLADSVPDEDAFTYLLSSCCVLIFERKEMTNGAKSFREWKRIAPRERRVGQEARLLLGLQKRNGTKKHEKICLATVCTHSSLSPQMWEAAGKSQAYLTQTWRTTEGCLGLRTGSKFGGDCGSSSRSNCSPGKEEGMEAASVPAVGSRLASVPGPQLHSIYTNMNFLHEQWDRSYWCAGSKL